VGPRLALSHACSQPEHSKKLGTSKRAHWPAAGGLGGHEHPVRRQLRMGMPPARPAARLHVHRQQPIPSNPALPFPCKQPNCRAGTP